MEHLQIEKALQLVQNSENIVKRITELYMRALGNDNVEEQRRLMDYSQFIRAITYKKLEEMTAALCVFAEDFAEEKSRELEEQKEVTSSPTK